MGKRILTTVIGIPILVFFLLMGSVYLKTALLVVSLIGLHEFYQCLNRIQHNPMAWVGYLFTIASFFVLFQENAPIYLFSMLALFTLFLTSMWVLLYKETDFRLVAITFMGFLYVPVLIFHIGLIQQTHFVNGIWLVFIISWASDSAAYFAGHLWGHKKLSPQISPKKTVEGAMGGLFGGFLGCIVFGLIFSPDKMIPLAILGISGSFIAQIGDLVASLIKRNAKIKDFGRLFPGHGGVLDRFDSILFTAPYVYAYILIILV